MDESKISDQERIRAYVVDVLINRFVHLGLDRHQIAQIAQAVLQRTNGLSSDEELARALDELAVQYPQIKPAEVSEWSFRDHKYAANKVNQLVDLLHQGNIESASALAENFEKTDPQIGDEAITND